MRGRRVISVVLLFSAILMVSGVFASGIVDVPLSNILSSTVGPLSPGTAVSVYPRWVIKDYTLLPVNSKFVVHVNISDVTDLFAWQLNVTWNKAILNASRIITGNNATYILWNTGSVNKTASFKLGWVINATNNAKGNAAAAETILDSSVGAPGVNSPGWLRMVSIEFKVVGYGKTGLTISTTGTLATTMLNSARVSIGFTKTDGYFDNRIPGDIYGPENPPLSGKHPPDRSVDGWDLTFLSVKFGTSDPDADFTGPLAGGTYPPDGSVDGWELTKMSINFGRSV
jgi:hypothetical protein